MADAQTRLNRIIDGVVDSIFEATDEEIEQECRDAGLDPQEVADSTRKLLLEAVEAHKRRAARTGKMVSWNRP